MERDNFSSELLEEDKNYPPRVKWCKRCSAYHFPFSLWQRVAHWLRLGSQYSAFEIVPVYYPYKFDPETNRKRQKKRTKKIQNKKQALIARTQPAQPAEDFRQGKIHEYERIQQAKTLFAGKRLLKGSKQILGASQIPSELLSDNSQPIGSFSLIVKLNLIRKPFLKHQFPSNLK